MRRRRGRWGVAREVLIGGGPFSVDRRGDTSPAGTGPPPQAASPPRCRITGYWEGLPAAASPPVDLRGTLNSYWGSSAGGETVRPTAEPRKKTGEAVGARWREATIGAAKLVLHRIHLSTILSRRRKKEAASEYLKRAAGRILLRAIWTSLLGTRGAKTSRSHDLLRYETS